MEQNGQIWGVWTANQIIRHKRTGHPYLVLSVKRGLCTFVIDLEDKQTPRPILAVTVSEYSDYARDCDMELIASTNQMQFSYNPIQL